MYDTPSTIPKLARGAGGNSRHEKLPLAAVAAIVLRPPAYAHKDCGREIVTSRDGWAQFAAQPGLSGKPLWRITNGTRVTWCGDDVPDNHGHPWKWITFQSEQEPWDHEGWVAAGLLGQSSPPPAPAPVPLRQQLHCSWHRLPRSSTPPMIISSKAASSRLTRVPVCQRLPSASRSKSTTSLTKTSEQDRLSAGG